LLLLTLATLCASAASPKRILILDPFGRDVAPFSAAISAFRTTLARELGEPLDFYEVPLDLARFAETQGEGPLVTFLEGRIKDHPVDLVVPIGGAGAQFVARHRGRLFPDTPVMVVAAEPRMLPPGFLRTNATLVTQRVNLPGMVEDILQMQPQTTNIVVVFGASALERFWVNECRREFQSFTNRVRFTWLNDLSLEQILERCAALPPRSFILHGLFLMDAAGRPCEKNEALRRLHEVANAPLFGYFASEFGLGPIGGRLFQDSEIGAQGARAAIRILRGERPGSIPPQVFEAAAPVFDWRELQRWGTSEARLPAGSVIQFRQPGFWERYRWAIVGTVSFCIVQAALFIALLMNRGQRRRGEAEATLVADISSKFVNLPAGEVDREIMEAERRICELLGVDLAALWQSSAAAPSVIKLTHLYRTPEGPQPPDGTDLNEHFPWFQQQLLAGRTIILSSLEELPAEADRDRENCRQFGVKSNLSLPLSVGGETLVGVLGFNTTRAERDWPDALVKRLQVVAQIFTNALARKRADLALRASEELSRVTFEQAAVGIAHVGTDGRWLKVNDKLCTIVGYPRDELMKLTFQDITHPEDLETDLNFARQVLSGEIKNYSMEKRSIRKDHSLVWIRLTVSLVRTAAGAPMHFISVVEDITVRKGADERFRLAMEASPNGIVLVNDQGRIVLFNTQTEALFGYSRAELIGQTVEMLVPERSRGAHPGHVTGFFAALQARALGAGRELFARRKDGTEFPVEIGLSPIQSAEGVLVLTAIVDITARKQAQADLAQLQKQNELILGSVAEGILGLDLQGNHLFVNPAAARMLGYETEELLGRHSHSTWHHTRPDGSPYPEEECNIYAAYVDGKVHRESTEVFWRKDGTSFPVEYASTPMHEQGRLLGAVVTFVDITERKQAEAEVMKQRAELAHVARVSTMGQLASSLAHELNQPLGAILRNAEAAELFLQDPSPDLEEVRAILADIRKDDQRAGGVIDRMRALMKRREVERRRLDLNLLVGEVVTLVRPDAEMRRVQLAVETAPALPPVQGDRVQLQQVLLNLLLNAMEAVNEDPPAKRLVTVRAGPAGATVEVTVSDTGRGIPEDQLSRVFEPFFTSKPNGLGMGLAISRSIIEAHGGRLWAENNPAGGGTFHFTLPAAGGAGGGK
jgi:PAS domain S-box-containing protein